MLLAKVKCYFSALGKDKMSLVGFCEHRPLSQSWNCFSIDFHSRQPFQNLPYLKYINQSFTNVKVLVNDFFTVFGSAVFTEDLGLFYILCKIKFIFVKCLGSHPSCNRLLQANSELAKLEKQANRQNWLKQAQT